MLADSQPTDPLNAYTGRDRILREAIENVLFRAIGDSDMRQGWRGTLPVANEIMALVKAETPTPDDLDPARFASRVAPEVETGAKRAAIPCTDVTVLLAYESGRFDAFSAVLASANTMPRDRLILWLESEIAQFLDRARFASRFAPEVETGAKRAPAPSTDVTIVLAHEGGRLDAFSAVLASARTMTRDMLIQWLEAEIARF